MESTLYSLFTASGVILVFLILVFQNFIFDKSKTFSLLATIPLLVFGYFVLLQMFAKRCLLPLPCSGEAGAMFLVYDILPLIIFTGYLTSQLYRAVNPEKQSFIKIDLINFGVVILATALITIIPGFISILFNINTFSTSDNFLYTSIWFIVSLFFILYLPTKTLIQHYKLSKNQQK